MIWGPFVLALALGLVVSAGLYWAYLWPQVEPEDPPLPAAAPVPEPAAIAAPEPAAEPAAAETPPAA